MKKLLLVTATLVVYALHQDAWFWRDAEPLLFGALPPGLWYHALYCLLAAGLMWLLVRHAWPGDLERAAEQPDTDRRP